MRETSVWRRAGAVAAALLLIATASGCCVAYRDHYDRAADQFDKVMKETSPEVSGKRVRYTVHVASYLGDELAEPISEESSTFDRLALRAVMNMRIFSGAHIATDMANADYHFIFSVKIRTTQDPGLFSGLIMPFYRARAYTVSLQVLDEKGDPFSTYVSSSEVFEMRHILFLPAAPFYLPFFANRNARHSIFEALSVKLINDRKEFL
jgi:hypothetical protein